MKKKKSPPRRYASQKAPAYLNRFLAEEPWGEHQAAIQSLIRTMAQSSDMGVAWAEIDRIQATHRDFGPGFVLEAAWLWHNIRRAGIAPKGASTRAVRQIKNACDALADALTTHAAKIQLWNYIPFGVDLDQESYMGIRLLELDIEGKSDLYLNLHRLVEGKRPIHLAHALPQVISLLRHLSELSDPSKMPSLLTIAQTKPGDERMGQTSLLMRALTCYVLREIEAPADRLVATTVTALTGNVVLPRQIAEHREKLYKEEPRIRALDKSQPELT